MTRFDGKQLSAAPELSSAPNSPPIWLPEQSLFGMRTRVAAFATEQSLIIADGPSSCASARWVLKDLARSTKIWLSHGPSFNDSDVWAREGAQVLLHNADKTNSWLGKNARHCTFWSGDRLHLVSNVTAFHTGGHSPGHSMLHVGLDDGYLFVGDEISVTPSGDLRWERNLYRSCDFSAYLSKLTGAVQQYDFKCGVSLHCGVFNDAKRKILSLIEATR